MTRAQARAQLKLFLGNRTELADPGDYDAYLDTALVDLTTRRGFVLPSLERVGAPIAGSVGVPNYATPADSFAIFYLEDTTNGMVLSRFPGEFREFLEARQNAVANVDTQPSQFIEFGNQIWVGPAPPGAVLSWTPYYYARATWATDASAEPGIEKEWHRPLILIAKRLAAEDLGDTGRVEIAKALYDEWLGPRDTTKAMQRRFQAPAGGAKPHPSLRDRRFML